MRSNKHILIFTPGFPQDEADGSCLPTLQNYVRALAEAGWWEVSVVSLHYPFERKRYHWHGVPVMVLGGANVKYPKRFLLWKRAVRVLKSLHRQQPINIIHSFWMHECALIGNFFAKKNGIPHIITLMGQDLRPPNRFAKFIDQSYPSLVALSTFQPERIKAGIRVPDFTIPFGIPREEKRWLGEQTKKIDILGVGSLIKLKDYTLFIRIVAALKKDFPEITAEIVGEGVERQKLERMIVAYGLGENLGLPGQKTREEVYEKLGQSRVCLHTSQYETQAYVFNEALLAGVPIVSKAVGIAREENYWKMGADEEELVKAVSHFLQNPVEVPEEAGMDITQTVAAYASLYERSLTSKAKRAAIKR